jgi:hypothetical protein
MTTQRLKPREQGDLGELSAMEWLVGQGAKVFVPIFHSPDVDLIAELADALLRIQVKTSTVRNKRGRWEITISTRGGNQSWNGLVKYLDPSRCDYLFVLVGDGRRWFIPTAALECRSGLTLGGPKYAEFEIAEGQPPVRHSESLPLKSWAQPGEFRSGQTGRPVKALAQPSQVRILPPPSSPLDTSERLKPEMPIGTNASGNTTVYAKRRITIPRLVFAASWLRIGDRLRVTAAGPGRLTVERIDKPAASER